MKFPKYKSFTGKIPKEGVQAMWINPMLSTWLFGTILFLAISGASLWIWYFKGE